MEQIKSAFQVIEALSDSYFTCIETPRETELITWSVCYPVPANREAS